jgi:hypothetical protein
MYIYFNSFVKYFKLILLNLQDPPKLIFPSFILYLQSQFIWNHIIKSIYIFV